MQDDTRNIPFALSEKMADVHNIDQLPDAGDRTVVLHPKMIYQAFIDDLSAVNLSGDFEAWAGMSEYPNSVHTDTVDKVIGTPEDAKPFFDMVCALIAEHKIDTFHREAENAEFLDPSMIVGHHMIYMRSGGVDVVQPMASRMVIRKATGRWRMISVTNAVANDRYPYDRPEPSDGLIPDANVRARQRDAQGPGSARHLGIDPEESDPLTIYAAFLTAVTAANREGDFELWDAMHLDRVRKHTPEADMTIDSRTERRAIFDAITDEIRRAGADSYVRQPDFAEWLGPDRIRGKHRAIMSRDGQLVRQPLDSQFVLVREAGAWKVADVTNSFDPGSRVDLLSLMQDRLTREGKT
ncbi:hypothetical protein [Pseudaestuariivita atlantica]|uniref:SnoaL-like domain-containing protein n=1 Tax=Pseudaestuariivita atlantica TaxID=1317121 RepID=A0A0L1JR20_9RHOB|nr:hypothetical protein [Pseudaestuariivita atlantica]KNG94162.1 hypothetical protein ATO11_08000 [Pseudaestuariivita atlantica]